MSNVPPRIPLTVQPCGGGTVRALPTTRAAECAHRPPALHRRTKHFPTQRRERMPEIPSAHSPSARTAGTLAHHARLADRSPHHRRWRGDGALRVGAGRLRHRAQCGLSHPRGRRPRLAHAREAHPQLRPRAHRRPRLIEWHAGEWTAHPEGRTHAALAESENPSRHGDHRAAAAEGESLRHVARAERRRW